jgi:hypothetical protein
LKEPRRPARDLVRDPDAFEPGGQLGLEPGVSREPEHVLDSVRFAPAHQLVAREPGVGPHKDLDLGPAGADLRHDALEFVDDALTRVDVRLAQSRHQQVAAAEQVQRQVTVVAEVAVEEPPFLLAVLRVVGRVPVGSSLPMTAATSGSRRSRSWSSRSS